MQSLLDLSNTQTMTSVEVVEVINTLRPADAPILRHGHFMDRCKRIAEELYQPPPRLSDYVDSRGKTQPCYLLDKEMCLILVASESAKVMQAIIRRWQELEEIQRQALPQTHIQAVEAYLHTLKTVEAQMLTIGSQQKVIDHKKIRTDDSMTHTTMVRVRKLNPGEKYSSLRLTAYCEDNELSIEKVYDAHEQPVNNYPNEAWENVYPDVILPAHL